MFYAPQFLYDYDEFNQSFVHKAIAWGFGCDIGLS